MAKRWQIFEIPDHIDKLVIDAANEKGLKKNAFIVLAAGDAAREVLKDKTKPYELFDNVKMHIKNYGLDWTLEDLKEQYLKWMDGEYVSGTAQTIFNDFSSEFAEFFRRKGLVLNGVKHEYPERFNKEG